MTVLNDGLRATATREARPAIILAMAAYACLGVAEGGLGVAFPSISDTFGLAVSSIGLLLVPLTCGYLAATSVQASLTRRIGRPAVLIVAAGAATTGALGYAIGPWIGVLVLGSFLLGLSAGWVDTSLNSHASLHWEPRVLAFLHGGFGVGATLGPLLFTSFVGLGVSWRAAFALLGLAHLGLGVGWFRCQARLHSPPVPSASSVVVAFEGDVAFDSDVVLDDEAPHLFVVPLNVTLFFLYTGAEASTGLLVATLLVGRGSSAAAAGVLTTAYWASLTAGRFVVGWLGPRVTPPQALAVGSIGLVVGMTMVAFGGVTATAAGLLIVGVSLAPFFPSLVALTPHRVGRARTDRAMPLQLAAASIGVAAVPATVGVVAGRLGTDVIGVCLLGIAVALSCAQTIAAVAGGEMRDLVPLRDGAGT